jgi:hypothetical protein
VFNKFINQSLVKSILINLILIIPALSLLDISYDTNDDIGMMFLTKGTIISNEGTNLILFSSPILGGFLRTGFEIFPEINFYTYFYLSCFFIAHVFMLNAFLTINAKRLTYFLFLSLYLLFSLKILLMLQFTIISTVMSVISICYCFLFLKSNQKINLIIALCFFIVGLIVRPKMALMVVLFSIPFLFFYSYYSKKIKELLLFLSIGISIYYADQIFTENYYSNNNYNFKMPQLFMATYFTDYKLFYKLPIKRQNEIRRNYNWTRNDTELFSFFCLKETEFFSKQKLSNEHVLNDYNLSINKLSNKTAILFLVPILKHDYFWACVILISVLIYYNRRKLFENPLLLGAIISFSLIIIFYFLMHLFLKKAPERLVFSFSLVSIVMIIITFLIYEEGVEFSKLEKRKVFSLILFLVLISLFNTLKRNYENREQQNNFYADIKHLNQKYTYINFINGINFSNMNPFDNLNEFNHLSFYTLGSSADHPSVLSKYPEIKKYNYRALLQKDYYILADSKISVDVIERLLRVHFKEKYNFQIKSSIQKIGSLYSLKFENPI